MPAPLRIGCVQYLNARPLIRGWPGQVIFDHPAALCAQLANGDVDVALVSSFEYLRNPIYQIVDGVSISSAGPVYSVVVAYHGAISEIDQIQLDPASETSANLLRCLLAELGMSARLVTSTSPLTIQRGRLLIGDQAIQFRYVHDSGIRYWDLGQEWQKLVNLPFVYALWLIRPEFAHPKMIANRLRAIRDENMAKIDKLIAEEKEFDRDFCNRYFREQLRYGFGKKEKEGLRAFHELCVKHELLPMHELEFNLV